jgi:hypothetical protein
VQLNVLGGKIWAGPKPPLQDPFYSVGNPEKRRGRPPTMKVCNWQVRSGSIDCFFPSWFPVERRRRDRINELIKMLAMIVPGCQKKDATTGNIVGVSGTCTT